MRTRNFEHQAKMQRIFDRICSTPPKQTKTRVKYLQFLTDVQLYDLFRRLSLCSPKTGKAFKSMPRIDREENVQRMIKKLDAPIYHTIDRNLPCCYVGAIRITTFQYYCIAPRTIAAQIRKFVN